MRLDAGVRCFASGDRTTGLLFAGDEKGRIFRSLDHGEHWTEFDTPATLGLTSLALSRSSAVLYAGTYNAVWISSDGGSTWSTSGLPSDIGAVQALAIDPSNDRVVYAGTGIGVFRTSDGGTTWTQASDGLPPNTHNNARAVTALAVDPLSPSTLYAGLISGGLFRSLDGGSTWISVGGIFSSSPVYSVVLGPAPVPRSVRPAGRSRGRTRSVSRESLSDSIRLPAIYVGVGGSDACVYRSFDGGTSWQPAAQGFFTTIGRGSRAYSLAIDLEAGGLLFAGTQGVGVYTSSDYATTWQAAEGGLPGSNVTSIATADAGGRVAYATTAESGFGVGASIFKSNSHGEGWAVTRSGGYDLSFTCVTVDPRVPTTIWACGDSGALKSIDAGLTWAALRPPGVNSAAYSIVLDPRDSKTVYAEFNVFGFYKSLDGGATWTKATTSRPFGATPFFSFVISPSSPDTIFGLTGTSVVRSTDAGATWITFQVDSPFHHLTSLAIDPQNPATLYVGAFDPKGGVFKSLDAGQTWKRIGLGIRSSSINAIAVDPSEPLRVFAGGLGGVWVSENGGEVWRSLSSSLPYGSLVQCLAASADGTALYAGTQATGVWSYEFRDRKVTTLPLASSIHGPSASFFHSDVRLLNLSFTRSANVTARYRCSGSTCASGPQTFSIPPRQVAVFDDIVSTLFGASESEGAIEFESTEPIVVASRRYTPSGPGQTVGAFVAGSPAEEAFPISVLPGLSHSADSSRGFRSSIGFFNGNDEPQNVVVELFSSDGVLLGQATRSVGPRQAIEIIDVFRSFGVDTDVPLAYAVVRGDGLHPLLSHAVVTDNQSQDADIIRGSDAEALRNPRIVLTALPSLHGNPPEFRRADLILLNAANAATAGLSGAYSCLTGCFAPFLSLTLPAGNSAVFPDIVGQTFNRPETAGAVTLFGPPSFSSVVAMARVYSPTSPESSLGTIVAGHAPEDAFPYQVLTSLSNNSDSDGGTRTAVGVFNEGSEPQVVSLTLYNDLGQKLGETSLVVGAGGGAQIDDVFAAAGVSSIIPDSYCVVRGTDALLAYATVTDFQSQDSTRIEGARDSESAPR